MLVTGPSLQTGPESITGSAAGPRARHSTQPEGIVSPVLYAIAIPVALVLPLAAFAIYVAVAVMWFVPDIRIERRMPREPHAKGDG